MALQTMSLPRPMVNVCKILVQVFQRLVSYFYHAMSGVF